MNRVEQLYHEALTALIAGITTENAKGIWWESNGASIQIKRFWDQFRIIQEGNKYWYLNDKLHRTDGPAVEYSDGAKRWFLNGQLHRTDGPAVEYADGSKCWFLNGLRHRTDGPAVELSNGTKYWYVNDAQYTYKKFMELRNASWFQ